MQARSIRGARKIGTSISALSHAESLRLEKFTNEDLDPLDRRPKEAIRLRAACRMPGRVPAREKGGR